ncbi:MAG: MFS transporter [Kiritimatiellae bacterium]|jgi:OFA family oxalate/formate antiporter-like MFS transporter|nr:MFS transporter [Kiritimatiellia bacterium]
MKNRWIALAAGCLIQTILGGIYAWSTFVPYLMKTHDLNAGQCGLIFGVTILTFTISMIFSGWVLTKIGSRLTAGIAALLFMSGYLIASFSGNSFPLLLLGIGGITGMGIGFGYVCPLSVAMRWFPEKKGMVTGVAVAGFGAGAVLLSSIAERLLLNGMDVLIFFRRFGICSGIILLLAASLLVEPRISKTNAGRAHSLSSIFTWPFYVLAIGMFAGTFAGLLIIGHLTPLVMKAGLTEGEAAISVSIFAVGNAIGRITWGKACDHLGHKTIPLSLCSFAVTTGLLLVPLPKSALLLTIGLLGFGFGANFVVYASSISRHFGAISFPRLYPLCFLAYGLAGFIAPGVGGYLADKTNSYDIPLYISIALVSFAGVLSYMKINAGKTFDNDITAFN